MSESLGLVFVQIFCRFRIFIAMINCHLNYDTFFGRILVTSDTAQCGDIVAEELPFAYGPKNNTGIVCLNCYRYLKFRKSGEFNNRCSLCGWPLCSSCSNAGYHSSECKIFTDAKATFAGNVTEDGVCAQMNCVTPLRVVLAKEADPLRWENEVAPMEHHEKARRRNIDIWQADRVNIAKYIRGPCKLGKRFSEALIMQVVGLLEINAFEARTTQGYPIRCLYPIAGILAHNCVPNTARYIFPSKNYKIELRATCRLDKGTQLHHSYTYTLDGTFQRQNHLESGKFFECTCMRCKDPSELGTNFSTLRCRRCGEGWLRATNPLNIEAAWKCTKCGLETTNESIQKMLSFMQSEISDIQKLSTGPNRLEQSEQLIEQYGSILHSSHYIIATLRQNLIELYGRVQGYEMVKLSNELLEKKIDFCKHQLLLLDVFEPGLSRSRALHLYELHLPLVFLAINYFKAGILTKDDLKRKLENAIYILRECIQILKYEDDSSQEGILRCIVGKALKQLNLVVKDLLNDRILNYTHEKF